ncbi:MAG: glycoside hydrolase [Actinomycetota bacterium]|nr:glycoside hydrolase [Actinomycetota bacterium]
MRRTFIVVVSLLLGIVLTAPAIGQSSIGGTDGSDDQVTGQAYVRHDGGTDAGIRHCNNKATNPAEDDDPDDADVDSNDGGRRRQANEPFSVVDPTDPDTVVAGWNDYCLTDLGAGWQGFAYSTDRGETWTDSLVPGYPQDTSEEGQRSPLYGDHTDAGDPIAAFDNDGNLFVGGISFNRTGPVNGDVYVATYGTNPVGDYPVDYLRTRIVGEGTPTRGLGGGIFQDKPLLEVDRTGGEHDGNVYVCWSRFTGGGQNRILFSRSTDTGRTFSRPISLTTPGQIGSVQGCDIAVEADGDVYVTYRTFPIGSRRSAGLAFNRSTDGGASFGKAQLIRNITEYFPSDGARDCGDGPYVCPTEYVFHRVPLEPRVTSDQSGELPGVYLTYNAIRPGSTKPSKTSFTSAGPGAVGQSLVYVIRTTNNGVSWSQPKAVDAAPAGHQFFSDIDAHSGEVALVWQDSRTDPAYSVQRPIGNTAAATSSGTNIVNSFFTHSGNGTSWADSTKVSSASHQSQYEMFGSRDIPFHGDYNWISLANTNPDNPDSPLRAYMTWTDNRDVVPGTDPREDEQDGFDVQQCRVDLGENTQSRDDGPLARRDAPFTGDNCGNGGGLDQNIYGSSLLLP